jgi:hypothetical protein
MNARKRDGMIAYLDSRMVERTRPILSAIIAVSRRKHSSLLGTSLFPPQKDWISRLDRESRAATLWERRPAATGPGASPKR